MTQLANTNHRGEAHREKATTWCEQRGMPAPQSAADYQLILKRIEKDRWNWAFVTSPVRLETLPDAEAMDDKSRMEERLHYDERTTFPPEYLTGFPREFFQAGIAKGNKLAVAKTFYRCTGGAWVKHPKYRDKPNQRWWIYLECGEALPAVTGFNIVHKDRSKGPKNLYCCTVCRSAWGYDAPEADQG